ncbi:hypothetical protein GQ43DRAFT_210051 [Delitschia confertaspora ATCC 74209]|uniref:Uncharacterized protein n=1 Tax=Delitschia confertaspora ATCC 74209 TaxID=1513339 RepID=A0A9P4JUH0_9PLEO|nr:hypothetical protein GQ43DRAFT_210051 [Delitschia confertaspora ATCC 74209]
MLDTLPFPTRDLDELSREERSFTFAHFTCEHAWVIGNILRNALRTVEAPALIHISLSNSMVLFHSPSLPGLMPDNEIWVARKRETVLRWGHSSWYMHNKFGGDEGKFREKYGLGMEEGGKYAIHGGAYPIFVKGVEGVVGVIVVSGLKQEQDHQIVVKAISEYRDLRDGVKSPQRNTTLIK